MSIDYSAIHELLLSYDNSIVNNEDYINLLLKLQDICIIKLEKFATVNNKNVSYILNDYIDHNLTNIILDYMNLNIKIYKDDNCIPDLAVEDEYIYNYFEYIINNKLKNFKVDQNSLDKLELSICDKRQNIVFKCSNIYS
jgi:subtilase family serine protease